MIIDQSYPEYAQSVQRKHFFYILFIVALSLITTALIFLFRLTTILGTSTAMILVPTIALVHVPMTLWMLKQSKKVATKAEQHNDLLCTKCTYPMDQLTDAQECPECGKPWTPSTAQPAWEHYRDCINRKNKYAPKN